MKILFLGTPEFAVASLKALALSHHELAGVVTAPDKPVGRGLKIQFSPIKKNALDLNLHIFQPENLFDSQFIHEIRSLEAQLFVVVAFRILPSLVFKIPPDGTINLHASLLPNYRGAAPINWAIINGENETGLTTIFIQEKVDTGDIILQKKVGIKDNETAGELHDNLSHAGAELLLDTIDLIEKGSPPRSHQTDEVTKAPKLTREIAKIHWHQANFEIHNLVRGLNPSPGAFCYFQGKTIKIIATALSEKSSSTGPPGELILIEPKQGRVVVAAGSGNLEILELQLEGKRRMKIKEYLSGHALNVGDKFE